MINGLHFKEYRGAHIHLINYWQDFVVVVFYRGRFYDYKVEAEKKGEYTNEEYIRVISAVYEDAKKFVDAIRVKRSLKNKIKEFINEYQKKKRRGANRV